MANGILADDRESEDVRSGDGLLGWVPAIVVGYATILTPLLLQQSAPSLDNPAAAAAGQGSNASNQIFWMLLLCGILYACRDRLGQLMSLFRQPLVAIIVIYMVVAFCSVLWSPAPSFAFRRAVLQAIVLAAVVLPILLAENGQAQVDRLLAVFFATIAINLVAVLLLPTGRLGHQGIYSHKNELGLIVAYGFIFCLYGIVRLHGFGRLIAIGCAGASLLELVVSRSKTSLGLAILIPILALAIVAISRLVRVNALFPMALGLALSLSAGLFVAHLIDFSFADLSMILFDDTTFTGRTIIWDFLADVIGRSPILGQGYGSFWDIGPGSIVLREAPGFVVELLQGHNGYVDVTVELGIVGLCLLLVFLVCVSYQVGRAATDDRVDLSLSWLFMSCTIIGLCHNMLESSWFRGYSVVWMIFLLVGAWAQSMTGNSRASEAD